MNNKYYFKPLSEIKDMIINSSNGIGKVYEYDGKCNILDLPVHVINTTIKLCDTEIMLKEVYYHYDNFSENVNGEYTLTVKEGDKTTSYLCLSHWLGGEVQGEIDDYIRLEKTTGIFSNLKPSELPIFYRSWYFLFIGKHEMNVFINDWLAKN